MITGKLMDTIFHAAKNNGTLMPQVTMSVLDFMFHKSEDAEYFANSVVSMVPCVVLKALPDMVSVKVME
jgi:hypothetical protein